jgi:hypothetical protein
LQFDHHVNMLLEPVPHVERSPLVSFGQRRIIETVINEIVDPPPRLITA